MKDKVKQFAIKNGYDDAIYIGKWRSFECYEPVFNSEGVSFVGLPLIILVTDDGKIRMSTPSESLQQIEEGQ